MEELEQVWEEVERLFSNKRQHVTAFEEAVVELESKRVEMVSLEVHVQYW